MPDIEAEEAVTPDVLGDVLIYHFADYLRRYDDLHGRIQILGGAATGYAEMTQRDITRRAEYLAHTIPPSVTKEDIDDFVEEHERHALLAFIYNGAAQVLKNEVGTVYNEAIHDPQNQAVVRWPVGRRVEITNKDGNPNLIHMTNKGWGKKPRTDEPIRRVIGKLEHVELHAQPAAGGWLAIRGKRGRLYQVAPVVDAPKEYSSSLRMKILDADESVVADVLGEVGNRAHDAGGD